MAAVVKKSVLDLEHAPVRSHGEPLSFKELAPLSFFPLLDAAHRTGTCESIAMIHKFDKLAISLPTPDGPDANAASCVQELLGGKFGEMSLSITHKCGS